MLGKNKQKLDKTALKRLRQSLLRLGAEEVEDMDDLKLLEYLHSFSHYVKGGGDVKRMPTWRPLVEKADKKQDSEVLNALLEQFQINREDLMEVYDRCGSNAEKTSNVLKLMALTFQTDIQVLDKYEPLMKAYGKKLSTA